MDVSNDELPIGEQRSIYEMYKEGAIHFIKENEFYAS